MHKVVLSEFVEGELTDIWEFIAFDNMDAADRFLESAQKTFQELAQMPEMGRPPEFFKFPTLEHAVISYQGF